MRPTSGRYIRGKQIKSWKNNEGNICFSFEGGKPFAKPWIPISIGVLFLGVMLAEYLTFNSVFSFFPLIIVFMFILIYCIFYPNKDDDMIREKMMNINADLRLHNYLRRYDEGVFETKRKFYQETKGTYGIVVGIYMLVLLSNDDIIEFELKFHPKTEAVLAHYEFTREPQLCVNAERRKIIEKKSLTHLWAKLNISESTKLSCVILIIMLLGCLPLSLFIWMIKEFQEKTFYYILGFIFIPVLFNWLTRKSSNNIVKLIATIISVPMTVLRLSFKLMEPVMTVLTSYALLGMFSIMLPIFSIGIAIFVLDFNISKSSILFISLVFASITSVYGSRFFHWLIKEFSPLKNWGNHKYEAVRIELALYVINKKNVTFLIYFAYLVFLFLSGFMQIQYNEPLIKENIDSAVLKSFIVFIAFSNMVAKSKETEIEAKPLLTKMLQLITVRG